MRPAYLTDLSDAEWSYLEPHFPAPEATGRPRLHHTPARSSTPSSSTILKKSGCAWRLLPHDDFPPWKTVHHYFRTWRIDGTWENLNSTLRERLRARIERNTQPSAATVDSQAVKTTGVVGGERGYDSGKKEVKGRKRHLLVDTQGLVLKVKVHPANLFDRDGIKLLLERVRERFQRLSHLWVDAGYNGKGKGKDWIEKELGLAAQVVKRLPRTRYVWVKEGEEIDWERIRKLLPEPGFKVLPRRWVVERTFSWIGQNMRRMSKDYERLAESSEAFVCLPSNGALDGEAIDSLMRLFGRFLSSTLAICERKGRDTLVTAMCQ